MSETTCDTCRFNDNYTCRRFPPQLVLWPSDNQHPVLYNPLPAQPMISPRDWCGEHQPKEPSRD